MQHAVIQLVDTDVCRVSCRDQLVLSCHKQALNIVRLPPKHSQLHPLLGLLVKLNGEDPRVYTCSVHNAMF
jgi:hypothetical protein